MPELREPLPVTQRPFGLFSVESPTQKSDGPWATGAEWEPNVCGIQINYANALCTTVGIDEVQTLAITGTPTGGTYTLGVYGETTTAIAYNANAATVQARLIELNAFNAGDVTVSGTYPTFTLTYGGQYDNTNVQPLSVTPSLTGGTAPTATLTTGTQGARTPKTVTPGGGTTTADPFSVYILRGCRTVGQADRMKGLTMDALVAAEQAAVEKELWARYFATATDITPGTVPSVEAGIAMLEEAIGDRYFGRPVLHGSLNTSQFGATKGAIERHGNRLETKIGSYWVAGAGYPRTGPAGAAPAAGTEWLVATGALLIERGNALVQGPFLVQTPLDNESVVLAERTYVAGFDCQPVAIRVNFPA
jgi:hypothetical protein